MMKTMMAFAAVVALTGPVQAQYYERPPPPPPGYYPSPGYPPPGYAPPAYGPPLGRHCEAFMRTPYGPERLFCRIVDPKPLGMECACPPPPPPAGYAPGPYVGGRTVR